MGSHWAREAWRTWLVAVVLTPCVIGPPSAHAEPASPPLSTAGPLLDDYAKRLHDLGRPEIERLQLVGLLANWQTDQVRAPLISVLRDPVESIRIAAARGLGWKGNAEAVAPLLERVQAPNESVAVRMAALESLGRIGDAAARPALMAATSDANPAIRGVAFKGLAFDNLNDPAERTPLLRRIAADRGLDPYIRCEAIQALAVARDADSAELLVGILATEPSVAMPMPPAAAGERELMAIRYRQARDVKAFAAKAVWVLEARAAIPLLLRTAEDPGNFFLRLTSLETLASWRVFEAMPVFLRRLDDPFDQNRITALWGLADLRDPGAVDAVARRLSDEVPAVRAQAVEALRDLGDPRVRPQLLALQEKDPDARVQEALEDALAKLKP